MLHLVFQFNEEGFRNVADRSLRELFKRVAFALLVDLGKFLFKDGGTLFKTLLERTLESFVGLLLSSLALAFADVGPGSFNVRHCTTVDGIDIAASEVVEHVSTQLLAVHDLGLDAVDNLASQAHELLHEFRSQLFDGDLLKRLEILFLSQRANHCAAVSFLKERLEHATNAVLLLYTVRETFLRLKCFFKVLFRSDGFTFEVNKLQGEITHHPHKGREVLAVLFGVDIFLRDTLCLELNMSGQVDDE